MKQNPGLISILMTVHGDEGLKEEARLAGIRGYLEKPFDLKQLEEAISLGNDTPTTKTMKGGEKDMKKRMFVWMLSVVFVFSMLSLALAQETKARRTSTRR